MAGVYLSFLGKRRMGSEGQDLCFLAWGVGGMWEGMWEGAWEKAWEKAWEGAREEAQEEAQGVWGLGRRKTVSD